MLGLALELRQRGHDVTFGTNEYYEPLARKYDMPFERLGTREEFDACIKHPDLWNPRRSFHHIFQCLKPTLQRQFELYSQLANQPDAVGVTSCFGFGALIAHEKTGVPLVTVHLQPAVLWSDIQPPAFSGLPIPKWMNRVLFRIGERFILDPVVWPTLNAWREQLGLSPKKQIARWWHSPYAIIGMFPEWFCSPQADWPPNTIQTDFPLWNDHSGHTLSPELESFLQAGEPPLAFTPGSTNLHGRDFFEAAVDACRRLSRRGILLTEFPDQLPKPLPAGVMHVRYVPLELLLPRCAAFVHHGGIGSASQAMAAGIPQLIMPLAHDQFDNAKRIQRRNLGDWVGTAFFTGKRVASRLDRLLSSQQVAQSCREAAAKLQARDGLARTAAAIEKRAGL